MKVRKSFVANSSSSSSSSSFIIDKTQISHNQINKILNHIEFAKKMPQFQYVDERDAWNVEEFDGFIKVSTIMDNFDMAAFLRLIHIKDEHFT